MEKVRKSIRKEYLPVKIYIDDIKQMVELFDVNKLQYSIETDDYKYDNISELIENEKEKNIKTLRIQSSSPFMYVEFEQMGAKVYFSADGLIEVGIFHKIDDIIKRTRRLFPFIYNYYFALALSFFLLAAAFLINEEQPSSKLMFYFIALIWFLFVTRAAFVRLFKHSLIQLIEKKQKSSFFIRKRDELLLVIISAFVGAILAIIGTIIAQTYF